MRQPPTAGYFLSFASAALILSEAAPAQTLGTPPIKLNEIQVIGTHNSYHIEPSAPVMALIRAHSQDAAASISYSHKPLREQLGNLGMRKLELDLYADPEGGLFAEPAARKIIKSQGGDPGSPHDPGAALSNPGLKILHSPDFDFLTTNLTFTQALKTVHEWSGENSSHVPILIMLEMKSSASPGGVTPVPFDREQLDSVDREILSVFSRDEILAPDDVRGDAQTLREVIVTHGWPRLDSVRGKVMFALDNGGKLRDAYLEGHPSLRGRLLFASVAEKDPAAAWFKINDPVGEFDRIQRLVRSGFMVRTRADAGTVQARKNDREQRDKAFASGAQFISTDYPEPNPAFSDYRVRFEQDAVARTNPVSGSAAYGAADLEKMPGRWILCDGKYGGHLQGVTTDGTSLYWSHTVKLVKTDLHGKIRRSVDVPTHHGDLTWHDGKVFVAVEFGEFNQPAGQSDPWVYVYDTTDLKLLRKHRVPELVHGSGGIAWHDGAFVIVGGLPGDHDENHVFTYDEDFHFLNRHDLPSGQTLLGIQTAAYVDGHWWFGCYGSPGNPGLLKTDEKFRLVGQSTRNFSYGIVRLDADTVLRGECFDASRRGKVELLGNGSPEVEPPRSR